jgi:NAD(P)-dependent dehydrogenase (short-subunit alcohol dehydrogenase family)
MTYPTTRPATWFVTGASRGLGLALVAKLLHRGDNVTATTRAAQRLTDALSSSNTSRLLPVEVDLTNETQVREAIAATKERFGTLDVVVNNAGYGFLAAIEEVTDTEAREMFDVQVFGVWNVLRAVLPGFREARSGHIINVSSILGLTTFPGWGLYCAGKFALEGMTESLAAEVADFGIAVNLIEPGYLRTDFLKPHSLGLPTHVVDAYPSIREMTQAHQAMPGTQLGDPSKAAEAIIAVATSGSAPLHQLLGSDSLGYAEARVEALQAQIAAARSLAVTTDIGADAA